MKLKCIIKSVFTLLLLAGFSAALLAQSFDNISSGVRSGNASALARVMESNVELSLKGTEGTFSKAQAEVILQKFFASNAVRSFSVTHEGSSPEGSRYIIGNLQTSGGNYRAYIYAKNSGNQLLIREVRFED
jgi:hypothetical protein